MYSHFQALAKYLIFDVNWPCSSEPKWLYNKTLPSLNSDLKASDSFHDCIPYWVSSRLGWSPQSRIDPLGVS